MLKYLGYNSLFLYLRFYRGHSRSWLPPNIKVSCISLFIHFTSKCMFYLRISLACKLALFMNFRVSNFNCSGMLLQLGNKCGYPILLIIWDNPWVFGLKYTLAPRDRSMRHAKGYLLHPGFMSRTLIYIANSIHPTPQISVVLLDGMCRQQSWNYKEVSANGSDELHRYDESWGKIYSDPFNSRVASIPKNQLRCNDPNHNKAFKSIKKIK